MSDHSLWTTLTELRRALHRSAELSGHEHRTADQIARFLQEQAPPDRLTRPLAGTGLAATYDGPRPGKTLLIRCDLDALPIAEPAGIAHRSEQAGVAHKCGHDGHMAIAAGLAQVLSRHRTGAGRVTVLFQPAEETGRGAEAVLADPAFEPLRPDCAVALHNLPGFPLGQVIVGEGPFAAASRGLAVALEGRSAHAAEPHRGRSPALAVAQLVELFTGAPQLHTALGEAAQATVIHARIGDVAFGTSPGSGVVMATLRAYDDEVLERLTATCRRRALATARAHDLEATLQDHEPFPATVNAPEITAAVVSAARSLGYDLHRVTEPFAWSEDFGHFTRAHPGALVGLGAGTDHPALHSPSYDFPDPLIEPAVRLLCGIVQRIVDADWQPWPD